MNRRDPSGLAADHTVDFTPLVSGPGGGPSLSGGLPQEEPPEQPFTTGPHTDIGDGPGASVPDRLFRWPRGPDFEECPPPKPTPDPKHPAPGSRKPRVDPNAWETLPPPVYDWNKIKVEEKGTTLITPRA